MASVHQAVCAGAKGGNQRQPSGIPCLLPIILLLALWRLTEGEEPGPGDEHEATASALARNPDISKASVNLFKGGDLWKFLDNNDGLSIVIAREETRID